MFIIMYIIMYIIMTIIMIIIMIIIMKVMFRWGVECGECKAVPGDFKNKPDLRCVRLHSLDGREGRRWG